MTDDELVRERVMAYLADKRAFEIAALEMFRKRGLLKRFAPGDPAAQAKVIAAYREFQLRHRTAKARDDIHGSAFTDPPSVDPATTTITSITIKGSRATVLTLEVGDPTIPLQERRYDLQREDGHWLLAGRRWRDTEDGRWYQLW